MDIDRLEKEYTKVNVQRNVKFVDEFPIIKYFSPNIVFLRNYCLYL